MKLWVNGRASTLKKRENRLLLSTLFLANRPWCTCWLEQQVSSFPLHSCFTKTYWSVSKDFVQMKQKHASFNLTVSFASSLFKDKMIPNAAAHLIHLITIKHFALLMDSGFLLPRRASMLRSCRRRVSRICTQILSEVPLVIPTAFPLILHHISEKKSWRKTNEYFQKIANTRVKKQPWICRNKILQIRGGVSCRLKMSALFTDGAHVFWGLKSWKEFKLCHFSVNDFLMQQQRVH